MTVCLTVSGPRRFAQHAWILAAVVMLSTEGAAQTTPDIWSVPDVGAPQTSTSGETVTIDMREIEKTRLLVDAKLKSFAESGQLSARFNDLSAYSDETVAGLNAILEEGGDSCIQAVRSAVYLDGHIEEADRMEVVRGIERPWEMTLEVAAGFLTPDGNDVITALFSKFNMIDKAMDAYAAYKTAKAHYAQTALIRDGIASNEIVQEAARGKWTEADIQARRADLLKEAQRAAEEMLAAQQRIKDGLEAVDSRYEEKVQTAFYELKRDVEQVYGNISDDQLRALLDNGNFPNFKMAYDSKIRDAGKLRADEHQRVVKQSYALMQKTQFATERALAQSDALARYSAPMVRDECALIRRDGPVQVAQKKPDSVAKVLELPHDKMMIFLEKIGRKPSGTLLDCVCRTAGYGSPGTSQFYHPDTLGSYDKRYSCQHPGDPCIVSGFGCTRHPLPSDRDIWERCAASTGEDIVGAITDAVKARKAQKQP